ncbi:hypothetical protein [Bifidobacterium aerophilum]|uniref:Uncharacterized protein n=1 Tax=Bifidobacterium aerophilum TaxID=1798155 RepID=A0A6N9Z7R8_9BIFI|nr:hypothetical protein [Bifidobacterium aerophilum]NEG90173.1 hypothetical protein [Bifidobacterium aerophilum]
MTFSLDSAKVARVAALPAVREAAGAGARLVSLWPLTDAKQMDNDAKYAENLQVRLTRMIARVVTGEDVTVPDAEFVYEGADEIPGRPQEIVDVLLAANDAYDTMVGYRDAHDPAVLFEAASAMGVDWPEATVAALDGAMPAIETVLAESEAGTTGTADGETDAAAVADALARRFAEALTICDRLLAIVSETDTDHLATASLPVILFVNELREQLSVPRLCLTDEQYRTLLDARRNADDTLSATVSTIAPIAAAEWNRHYDDVTWDPDEAKRRAKEEDERKNKEALAAKFAHIKDDPSKPAVEL